MLYVLWSSEGFSVLLTVDSNLGLLDQRCVSYPLHHHQSITYCIIYIIYFYFDVMFSNTSNSHKRINKVLLILIGLFICLALISSLEHTELVSR